MTLHDFEHWLDRYGDAWVAGDPDAAAGLFTPDATYHETPFDDPMVGTRAIHRYWADGAKDGQSGVTFRATPIAFDGATGYAHWHATFRRVPSGAFVELDGVLAARFIAPLSCAEFREWWHRKETPAGTA